MNDSMRLVMCWGTALMLFMVSMLVYGAGLSLGWATWSGMVVVSSAMQNIAVGFVLWIFWD